MLRAAAIIRSNQLAIPILAGNTDKIQSVASEHGIEIHDIQIADPVKEENIEDLVEAAATGPRQLSPAIAKRLLRRPLMFGAILVRTGRADAMIAGASVPTAKVLEAGLLLIGNQPGIKTPSSFFLMRLPSGDIQPQRDLIFADCAVNVSPTCEQLADIAIATAVNARTVLNEEPRVAMLSFSSKGSAVHELVDRVAQAVSIVKDRRPELKIDGELQFDAAFDPRVAALKIKDGGPVAGSANTFIFPDLNSGNIGYKITQYLAGAKAIGPVLQGFAHPISDLSRGATVEDIVETTAVLLSTSTNRID